MAVVTHVNTTGPHGRQVVVHLDDERWTAMPRRWATRRKIEAGRAIDEAERAAIEEELAQRVGRFLCLASLARGDRSRAELERRLVRYGLPAAVVERAVATIDASGLVDDRGLARSLAASLRRRGYGESRIRQTLRNRGLPDVDREAESEDDAVLRAVEALGRRHRDDPRRAIGFLARRGFDPGICRRAVEQRGTDGQPDVRDASETARSAASPVVIADRTQV